MKASILKVEVELSDFEGKTRVSVADFIDRASTILAEAGYRAGHHEGYYGSVVDVLKQDGTDVKLGKLR